MFSSSLRCPNIPLINRCIWLNNGKIIQWLWKDVYWVVIFFFFFRWMIRVFISINVLASYWYMNINLVSRSLGWYELISYVYSLWDTCIMLMLVQDITQLTLFCCLFGAQKIFNNYVFKIFRITVKCQRLIGLLMLMQLMTWSTVSDPYR